MKMRLIAAAVGVPLLLIVLLALPQVFTAILVGAMCALAAYELLWGTNLVKEYRLVVYTAAMSFLVSMWSCFGMDYPSALLGVLGFASLLFMESLISHGKLEFQKIAVCLAGGLLIPFLLSALVRIRVTNYGPFHILIPFILAFTSDAGAYFAGRFLGKHKLAPVISPNKTVEGVVGGVAAAILSMLLYGLIMDLAFGFDVRYLNAVAYGIVGALAGVFGDLAFSAIKRQTGIKDYGNLIPGHGGVLDRFDSMTIVAPLTEAFIILIPVVVR